jgi:hypothetical protein
MQIRVNHIPAVFTGLRMTCVNISYERALYAHLLSLRVPRKEKKSGWSRGAKSKFNSKSKFTSQRKLLFELVQTSLLQRGKQTLRALRTDVQAVQ